MSGRVVQPDVARLAEELHREFCDRACPPASELHVADRQWAKHAYSIVGRLINRASPVAEPVAKVCGF